jgi:hypothetical protein
MSVNNMTPALGSEVEASVQLRNIDSHPIQIPWSTDETVKEQGQEENHLQWEAGTFEFRLRNKEGNRVALKSLTGWLEGSKFVPISMLTIQPGEYIAALVKFKVEDLYQIEPLRLGDGEWELSAEWIQVGRNLNVLGCAVSNAYFLYDHFYKQKNVPLTIQVTARDADNRTKPKP